MIVAIWAIFVLIGKHFELLSLDVGIVKEFVSENKNYAILLFIFFWIVRLLFIIPGTPLLILGGVCFNPFEAFLVSTLGVILSETSVYLFSKSFASHKVEKYLVNRHPELKSLVEAYNYKLLALGVICPIVPADGICFLSASVGINYLTYIFTIVIASTPLRLIYSWIGLGLNNTKLSLILIVVSFVLLFTVSIKIWNTLKEK